MRWCSWAGDEGRGRLGAIRDRDGEDWLLDVASWAASREATAPADLVDLVEASDATQRKITELVASAPTDAPGWLRPASVRLLAPLRAPNSLRDFLASPDQVEPVYYQANRRSISGPDEDVRWPSYTERLDYECEVAAVVGRGGRDWDEAAARNAIFGYVVMNDWSARDHTAGRPAGAKGKDFNTSLGPILVTADEWDPDDDHEMTVAVDGEVWSRGSTKDRRWTFAEMLAYVSRDEDVYPTDVLGAGTFDGGCGLDLDRWLAPGQTVTLAVDGLGSLTNRVVRMPDSTPGTVA